MRLNRFNLRRNTHYACRFNNMRSCLIFISTVPTIMDYLLISTRLLSLLEMSMVDLVAFWSNTLKQFFARIRTEIAPSIGDSSGTLNPIRAQSLLRGIFGGENCAFSAMLSTPDIVIRSSGPSVCLSVCLVACLCPEHNSKNEWSQSVHTWYKEWPWDIIPSDVVLSVKGQRSRLWSGLGLIAIRREFDLYQWHSVSSSFKVLKSVGVYGRGGVSVLSSGKAS